MDITPQPLDASAVDAPQSADLAPRAAAVAARGRRLRAGARPLLFSCVLVVSTALLSLGLAAYRTVINYTQPARSAPQTTPAAVGLSYEDVELLTEDELHLAGWYVPSQNGAAIILVHGLGGNRAELLGVARALARRGYGVLALDLRAHGESEGTVSTLSVHEVRDVRAAVAYLQERPDVEDGRIGILGASLGGATAVMAAAEIPEIEAVVADSAFTSIDWLLHHQFNEMVKLPDFLMPLIVEIGVRQTGVQVADIAPIDRIGSISPRPILLIHGEQDEFFLVENARLLADASGEPTELWIVPGVGHTGAFATYRGRYVERVARFFDHALVEHVDVAGSVPPS